MIRLFLITLVLALNHHDVVTGENGLFCKDFWDLEVPKSINFVEFGQLIPFLKTEDQNFPGNGTGKVVVIKKYIVVVLEAGESFGKVLELSPVIQNSQGTDCATYLLLPIILTVCEEKVFKFTLDGANVVAKEYADSYLPLSILTHSSSSPEYTIFQMISTGQNDTEQYVGNFKVTLDFGGDTFRLGLKRGETVESPDTDIEMHKLVIFDGKTANLEYSIWHVVQGKPIYSALPIGYTMENRELVIYDLANKTVANSKDNFAGHASKPIDPKICEIGDGYGKQDNPNESSKGEPEDKPVTSKPVQKSKSNKSSGGGMLFIVGLLVVAVGAGAAYFVIKQKQQAGNHKFKAFNTNSADIVLPTSAEMKSLKARSKLITKSKEEAGKSEATAVKSTLKENPKGEGTDETATTA